MTVSPASMPVQLPVQPPVQTPLDRIDSSIVRCGRCGSTQSVDLSQPVLTQVRPFVHAHLVCGPESLGSRPV